MHSKPVVLMLFIGTLLGLRQGLLWIDTHLAVRHDQSALIAAHNIDPAALFYTQSTLALKAEKSVRRLITVASSPDQVTPAQAGARY
jgi:hypothetical protein